MLTTSVAFSILTSFVIFRAKKENQFKFVQFLLLLFNLVMLYEFRSSAGFLR